MAIHWSLYLYTMLASIGGGFVQATTGFGFGIFVMLFFPLYLPLLSASALSQNVSLFLLTRLAWHYRKYTRMSAVVLPAIVYLLVSTLVIWLAPGMELRWLSIVFAVMMIVLAVYMLFFSSRVHMRASPLTAVGCSALSGAASGLFGIGGPPMTLYYMAMYGVDKYAYLGTIQFFFWITNVANQITRLSSGLLTREVLLLTIPGVIGQAVGAYIGMKVVDRIPVEPFRYGVYGFLAVAGVTTLVSSLV